MTPPGQRVGRVGEPLRQRRPALALGVVRRQVESGRRCRGWRRSRRGRPPCRGFVTSPRGRTWIGRGLPPVGAGAGEGAAAGVDRADVGDARRRAAPPALGGSGSAAAVPTTAAAARISPLEFRSPRRDRRVRVVGLVGAVDGREDRLEAVVVLLRDRVELVVVALGAVDREAHERADGVGDEVVAVEVPGDLAVDLRLGQLGVADEVPRPGGEEPERLDAVRRAGEQHVAGDLLLHEPRVRLVGVERADDVVAVRPGVRPRLVLVVAVRLAEVDDVEPVPRPPLAVVRRREQPVDQLLVRVRGRVVDEGLDLVRRRRQADQVEVQPADQRAPVGLRRRRQSPVTRQLREDEVVDRGCAPVAARRVSRAA